jgi:hypothetical protein
VFGWSEVGKAREREGIPFSFGQPFGFLPLWEEKGRKMREVIAHLFLIFSKNGTFLTPFHWFLCCKHNNLTLEN